MVQYSPSATALFGSYSTSSAGSTVWSQITVSRIKWFLHTRVCTELPRVFPCRITKMTVPTTGIKFSGKYITYRTMAFGVNFSKGFLINLPSLAIGSLKLPPLISLPEASTSVWCLETRTPSNVSTSASWIKKLREMRLMIVEDSDSMRRMVVKAASGPLTKTSTATWGR